MKTIQLISEATMPHVLLCACSSQGTRDYQQDRLYYEKGSGIAAVVCDGMGGLNEGGLASQTAVEIFKEHFGQLEKASNISKMLIQTVIDMDKTVSGLENERGEELRTGTTVAAVYIKGKNMYWISVGDSKVMIIRREEIYSITIPHTYGIWRKCLKWESGTAEKQYRDDALVSFIGMDGVSWADFNESPFVLQNQDIILVCTDGLYKALCEEQILQIILACGDDFLLSAETLVDMVYEYGKKPLDNCTVIAMKYYEEEMKNEA